MVATALDGLKSQIDTMLKSRSEHQAAIDHIDATLGRIQTALGMPTAKRRGRPPKSATAAAPATGATPKAGKGGRRKRGSFSMSGDESVVSFIKSHDGCTTKQVNQHWKGEGRGGSADNALTKLVKGKQLKRTQIKGERGSTYSIA